MSQQKSKSGAGKYCAYSPNAAVLAGSNKLRIRVPEDLKLVYLDVQDGVKSQPFQDNLNAFSSYAGSNVDEGGTIGEFILELRESDPAKPKTPGTGADDTDRKIWEGGMQPVCLHEDTSRTKHGQDVQHHLGMLYAGHAWQGEAGTGIQGGGCQSWMGHDEEPDRVAEERSGPDVSI